jgi:hypothetical protein
MIPKFYIGPMSKNVVDSIIEYCEDNNVNIGLIPSRRQVEWNGGYVNNWTTEEFSNYTKLVKERDHSGPAQGINDDNGYESLKHDCQYLDIIHIDPWKKYQEFSDGLKETIKMIEFCYDQNPSILYEVGTEEAIRRFEPYELSDLMYQLSGSLDSVIYKNIKYLVIQSGTSLKGTNQTGTYDSKRLKEMIEVCNRFNVLSKEHNGDYISEEIIKEKFSLGLNSINIAPEFGLIETQTYLDNIEDESILEEYWKICYESKKWIKWVSKDFNPEKSKIDLIKICGHYVLSQKEFIEKVKNKLPNLDKEIKLNIKNKLNRLYE